ncbi:MAG: cytochrome c biogenesis heme-transporting ATPase CcmA [Acidiferrobacterales bacterium]|nr:cytochrome c biogenesis heme-transporting ATPase CcmA [Acidiferrobacterales bacterium]
MHADPKTFPDAILSADKLACERGFQTLFGDLDFTLSSGQALQIVGANGVGKTSLLRIIATLATPLEGVIQWNRRPLLECLGEYRSSVSYLGHKQGLKADLTPLENLFFSGRIGGQPDADDSEITSLMSRFDLGQGENRPIRQLSAGQQQKVALIRVLLSDASIWLLDEPATSLDSASLTQLSKLMTDHLFRNGMIVFTSHQEFALPAERLSTLTLNRIEYD